MEWLVDNGYPQKKIDQLGDNFYTRHWVPTQEEIDNDNSCRAN